MASSNHLAEDAWVMTPFQGPLDVLFDRVVAIEDGWETSGGKAVGEVSPEYLEALLTTIDTMEDAMMATWPASEWQAYLADKPLPFDTRRPLTEQLVDAEFRLIQAWNAQVLHAFWAQHPDQAQPYLDTLQGIRANPPRMTLAQALS